jgi:predicted LPLAT superfamily acyltransferase
MPTAQETQNAKGWKPQGRANARMWRIYLGFLRVFGRMPIYLSMVVTTLIYTFKSSAARTGLESYLDRLFPSDRRATRLWRVYRVFFNYSLCIIDRFLALARGKKAFRWKRENHESLLEMLEGESGFVVLTTHCGNPEMLGTAVHGLSDVHKRVHIVRYQAEGDPYAELLASSKSPYAPSIIALNAENEMASMQVIRALRAGDVAAFLADRPVDSRIVRVPFLGGEIDLPLGPWLVASLAKVPVVVLSCFKEGPYTYRLLVSEPIDVTVRDRRKRLEVLGKHAAEFAAHLETWVRRYPYQFYNFYDVWDPDFSKLAD